MELLELSNITGEKMKKSEIGKCVAVRPLIGYYRKFEHTITEVNGENVFLVYTDETGFNRSRGWWGRREVESEESYQAKL
tara:strand:+ start:1082 stop:1321 length:240 start_codon:yes stop_codon:yes gene_type:complete